MPVGAVLIVAIVRDPALRSALVARLALSGITLLTATNYRDVRYRHTPQPAVLLIDEATMAGRPAGGIEPLRRERRWARIIVLARDAGLPAADGDRISYLARDSAAASLDALLAEWRQLASRPDANAE